MNLEMPVFGAAEYVIRRGAIEFITRLGKKKIALVADSIAVGKRLPDIIKMIEASGAECLWVADINREPYMQDIEEPIRKAQAFEPDCIVAIGGGSVLDTAKAIWIFTEHPEMTWEDAFKPFALPKLGVKAPLIAVPTTSGTGSETTFVAVYTDGNTRQKRLVMSREIIPTYAILDADFVDSLPSKVAAHSGMDALVHALEGAICVASSAMATSVALAACLDVFDWLPASVHPERYPDKAPMAKERMHVAASMAGMCIANTCCGLAHAFDQPGPYFGIPHGLVCGIFMPYTIKACMPNEILFTLARRMGMTGTNEELERQFVEYLHNFLIELDMPTSFKDAGVDEAAYLERLDKFVEAGAGSISTKLSPTVPNNDQIRQIFLDAYYGAPLYE